ncbi:hypothetical protein F441_03238 [Phytophthora nicotianae CJ01A1]|uniref:Myb-like domain-containing protein n=6 Tax=Phytophthora nicotianae TaxID=4792 RepID=W2QLX4_PHYN3|nr:hypothetical protein PPTG_07837 [Phytophthora nicotianae INRA-310]ETI53856.1 hypothetical protein F443_03253 [Phytophthora nicotianae P1569]ETK93715.1 hypothetical protein L915_03136 [Phytophthora nicotianae]ETO82543.1 hypothetical protein F444_03319 [Phytophthora nicotianae P1976]ETP23679.1 hypothetical protein F441_03238 [Phytophthora nicotianae CJ01A1]ETP51656.1 hypothetical protein F442_03234 [Phytophthora nicotianae P10297]KUF95161.1 hypothetical protein AM588_10006074 [Phytophthora n
MISPEVMQELLSVLQVLHYLPESTPSEKGWTEHEKHLFWVALAQHPQGPWTTIAEYIGTKSARQVMTHGQKLRQKLKRWNERLRNNPTTNMLMHGVTVSTSAGLSATAHVSVEAMGPSTDTPMSGASQPFGVDGNAELMVDDVSIVGTDDLRSGDYSMAGPSCMVAPGMGLPSQYSSSLPTERLTRPNVSEDTTRVVQLMLSETSEEFIVTDFSDDPEILPQDLLDDLLEILSDDDLNELSQHHYQPNMP